MENETPEQQPRRKMISLRLSVEMIDYLKRKSAEMGISQSKLIERALIQFYIPPNERDKFKD